MRLFYFINVVGTDTGISGIPRVVRNLGRSLQAQADVTLVPVRWCHRREAIVHAEQPLLDNMARFHGPVLVQSEFAGSPVGAGDFDNSRDWLLIAEVPHLASHDARFPSVPIARPFAYARALGLRRAAVFHDILPLTHPDAAMDETQREEFASYAKALLDADVLFPVSQSTAANLYGWLQQAGYGLAKRPRTIPTLLPEELAGVPRRAPVLTTHGTSIDFVTVGLVCRRKNQLRTMLAFRRLARRHPDLNLHLHVVGPIAENCARSVHDFAGRSRDCVHLYDDISDDQLADLYARSRASIFVSTAEGYGMPAAESLWFGTPSLCSNRGSIAEIAATGGCLSVDARKSRDIESAIETLATDGGRYQELLHALRNRTLRTWHEYSRSLLDALPQPAESGGDERATDEGRAAAEVSSSYGIVPPVFYGDASWFSIAEAYRTAAPPLRSENCPIVYRRDAHYSVRESILFYGPYIDLPAGRHEIVFEGTLQGKLNLRLTCEMGRRVVKKVSLDSFARPLVFDLTQPAQKFEIVGRKTASLTAMELEAISIESSSLSARSSPLRTRIAALFSRR